MDPNYNFDYDDDSDKEILTKCLKYDFEGPVPSLIYEELGKKKIHKKLIKRD